MPTRRPLSKEEVRRLVSDLDIIEDALVENGFDVEDYNNPEKGISRIEAILNAINKNKGDD